LDADRQNLGRIISEEHGKTLADAIGAVQRGIEVVEFAIGAPHLLKGEHSANVGRGVDCHSLLQPLGVCVGITPFNFPAMVPLWMFPIAIACGNTFVLKPSEKAPSASIRLAQLLQEAGVPDGVLNIVQGDKEAVDALLSHPLVRAVSFVGSTAVAKYVYATAAAHGKRVQALGGAKNHAIVMPDADVDAAADAITGAAFGSAGQRCMAISAVVAVRDVADSLVDAVRRKAAAVRIGPGTGADVEMGPVITAQQRDRIRDYIIAGVDAGATLALDGRGITVPGYETGFFIGPTIFDRVTTDMMIYRDEIFGPVLVVLRVDTLDEAIALVNRSEYGNGTAIFTRSGAAARRFEDEIEVGMVGVNVPIPVPMAFFSFGGWKSSLFGDLHIHGTEGIAFYTRTKAITTRWPPADGAASLSMPTIA
jgi:malonate-semialdehyde dehydrogenase (acetylating)/methylmalonate-semialdehyde dehydrogenase